MAAAAAAAAAAGVDGDGGLQAPCKGSRWESRDEFFGAVAAYARAFGYDVKIYKTDRKRHLIRCVADGCTFRARLTIATNKDGPGGGWVLRAISPFHSCDGSTQRKRNYRRSVVMCAAGSLAHDYVAPAGGGGRATQQLCDMVARHGVLLLGASQARRHITDGLCATAKHFVSELQFLDDYLRQLREQDPEGECGYG